MAGKLGIGDLASMGLGKVGIGPLNVGNVLDTVEFVKKANPDGLTILLVEQNVRAAIEVVDRLVLLERGRIVVEGSAEAMRDDPNEARRVFKTVKDRVPTNSVVYPRIRQLEKTFE